MPKKMKPGETDGPGVQVVVRLKPALLAALDRWARAQVDQPTRAESLRRMAARVIAEDGIKPTRSR